MTPGRPPRSYRTARERVALRRARGGLRSPTARRSGCTTILLGLLLVLVLTVVVAGVLTRRATQTLEAIEQRDPRYQQGSVANSSNTTADQVPATLREPFTILLLGVDRRDDPNEGVRSDTLIVVHVNPRERWAGMLSIPRDSVVEIPHLGQQKINAAYTYGYNNAAELYGQGTDPATAGGALAAETIENFLQLKVDYIAQVDFRGFEQIVSTLGGVTVDVDQPLLDAEYPTADLGVERIYIPAGLQVLDGPSALRYARSRHSSSDFDRSRRQQQVLQALLNEVRRRGLLEQAALLPELARDLESTVSTTLPISDLSVLRSLADLARDLNTDRIVQLSINPNDVQVISEQGSDIYWNADDVAFQVARLLAGPNNQNEVARIQVQNGAGVQGLAARVTSNLTARGFLMAQAGDAQRIYEHTQIIDYTNRPQTRQRLADLLGIEPQYVQATPPDDAPPAPYRTDIVIVLGQDYQERWAAGP